MKRQPRTVSKEQIQMDIEESKSKRGVRTIAGAGYHDEPKYEPSKIVLDDLPF